MNRRRTRKAFDYAANLFTFFDYAANLFTKASDLFVDIKLKLLASGNSAFCQALELSCKFDESMDIGIKMNLYPKVKLMLSKAASS